MWGYWGETSYAADSCGNAYEPLKGVCVFVVVVVLVAFPFLGLRVSPSFAFPHCTRLVQSAQLRLRRKITGVAQVVFQIMENKFPEAQAK